MMLPHRRLEMEQLLAGAGTPAADQLQNDCMLDDSSDYTLVYIPGHTPDHSPPHSPVSQSNAALPDEQDIPADDTPLPGSCEDEESQRLLSSLWSLVDPDHNDNPVQGPRLMDGKTFADGLSPFFAQDLCWNVQHGDPDSLGQKPLVPWPSSEEFACYGVDRARIGLRRYMPLPREDRLAKGFDPNHAVYNDDATLSAQFRHIELGRLYLDTPRQRTPRHRHLWWMKRKEAEVRMTDLPGLTQAFFQDIGDDGAFDKPGAGTEGGAEQDEISGGQVDTSPTPVKPRRGRRRFFW
ncbi:hypothetical protein F5X68DRAFT_261005 [Plectosphaerella plurivora]|uniref:Uncharacterized protein n=1 Tax=Plectosphaerella plurivora TaxID=936078 RepID=A0A9P8VDS2_9PEZI|nr:hypothetical protein F5X68DRAFT_261005 [Plectosphaerella plurivora]